ncbi:MAG: DUF951 domain-containing protein [Peptococcaceae bacterium]|nr:DUF951 domain-containing protein [Peptococcaceae bacterium]MBO5301290.1 DUF951 domain-containing protein [Peptococcaceae bacterium]MBP3342039.1 DUF951 domain-containing protein [Peptococcaceae bacterium]MBP3624665.1 DUF951 domain-containing protein [Peptococcaceae bacterium]MBQ2904983.1 DUF951 domain-containing protein [Peptococcaceae bacterium]
MPMKLYVGDIIQTKKNHPCGGNQWEIMRVGMDFRIRCTTCDHQAWIPRVKLEKSIKKVVSSAGDNSPANEIQER